MAFEWQNSHSVGTGGADRLNWRNMADCCFLDHHLYLGFYHSRLTFTSSTNMFYFIHKIFLWLDCPWCWNKCPLVENEMDFFFTASQFLMNMRIVLKRNREHVLQTKLAIKVIYGTIPDEAGWKGFFYKKGKKEMKVPIFINLMSLPRWHEFPRNGESEQKINK